MLSLRRRKGTTKPEVRPMTWEESASLISLPPEIKLPKYRVVVEGHPEEDDEFETYASAQLYQTYIGKRLKVSSSIQPI